MHPRYDASLHDSGIWCFISVGCPTRSAEDRIIRRSGRRRGGLSMNQRHSQSRDGGASLSREPPKALERLSQIEVLSSIAPLAAVPWIHPPSRASA